MLFRSWNSLWSSLGLSTLSRGYMQNKTFLQMFCKSFILHVTMALETHAVNEIRSLLQWYRLQKKKRKCNDQTELRCGIATYSLDGVILVHWDSRFELRLRFAGLFAVVHLLRTLRIMRRRRFSAAFFLHTQQLHLVNLASFHHFASGKMLNRNRTASVNRKLGKRSTLQVVC